MVWSAVLLVSAVGAFGLYYYFDQQGGETAGPMDRRIAAFESAVRERPESVSARINLAELYFAEKRYAESIEQYQVALQADEENKGVLVGLGRALLATGDHRAAAKKFQKAIDLASGAGLTSDLVETAHYYLGSISLTEGHPEEAVTHLKQALAVEGTDADAWYLLGVASLEADDVDGAIEALETAVWFVPNYTAAYEKLIVAYETKGLEAEGLYANGMLAYSQGQFEEAVTELEAAVKASPKYADAHAGLGLARESLGQREAALTSYQQAAELDPENYNAQAGLTRLGATAGEQPDSGAEVTP